MQTLADKGYQGAGGTVTTPTKGKDLTDGQRHINSLINRRRRPGERAFATLKTWKIFTKARSCPTALDRSHKRSSLSSLHSSELGQARFERRNAKAFQACDGKEAEVAGTTLTETMVAEVMAELAALEDPKIREVNEKHGDDHGVNLSKLREIAKRLKTQQELACQLWETDDIAVRLLAILICRPKAFERDELDVMLRGARTPKVLDWLVNYVVKKNPHSEELRLAWSADPDPVVASVPAGR